MESESVNSWQELVKWVENGVVKNIYTFVIEREKFLNYIHALIMNRNLDLNKCDIYGKIVGEAIEFILVEDGAIHIIKYSENEYELKHRIYRGPITYKEVKVAYTSPIVYEEVKVKINDEELVFKKDDTFKNFNEFVERL